MIKSRRMRWAGNVARMGEERRVRRVLAGKLEGRRPLGRPRRSWVDNIRLDLQELGCGYMDWIGLAQDRDRWRTLVSAVMNLRVQWNAGNFLTGCKPVSFPRRTLHLGVSKCLTTYPFQLTSTCFKQAYCPPSVGTTVVYMQQLVYVIRLCWPAVGRIGMELTYTDCCIYRVVEGSWNVMAHAQKPDFVFRRNGPVHLKRPGALVQSTTGSRGVRISDTNAGYTMFRSRVQDYWLPTAFASFPFTSPPVRHRVPSHFNWSLPPDDEQ